MPLLDTLTGGFSQDGFSLDGVLGGVGTQLEGVNPAGPEIDTGSLGGIAGRLAQADPGAIGGALEEVLAASRARRAWACPTSVRSCSRSRACSAPPGR